jgi:hypothetical protein
MSRAEVTRKPCCALFFFFGKQKNQALTGPYGLFPSEWMTPCLSMTAYLAPEVPKSIPRYRGTPVPSALPPGSCCLSILILVLGVNVRRL